MIHLSQSLIYTALYHELVKSHHHHHQSLNREGRWGTTDDFATRKVTILDNITFLDLICSYMPMTTHLPCGFISRTTCLLCSILARTTYLYSTNYFKKIFLKTYLDCCVLKHTPPPCSVLQRTMNLIHSVQSRTTQLIRHLQLKTAYLNCTVSLRTTHLNLQYYTKVYLY